MKHNKSKNQKHDNTVSVQPSHQPPAPAAEAPPRGPLTPRQAFDAASLARRQRADSFFHSLDPLQQATLMNWLDQNEDIMSVFHRATAPPPEGLGLKVHLTSLRRLRAHFRAMVEGARSQDTLDMVHDMEARSDFSQTARVQNAILEMLNQKAFELARVDPCSDTLNRLLTSIEKLSALGYKRQKLTAQREKPLHPSQPPSPHRVELSIVPAPSAPLNIVTVQPSPPEPAEPPLPIPAPPAPRPPAPEGPNDLG